MKRLAVSVLAFVAVASCNDAPVLEPSPAGDVLAVSAAMPGPNGPPMHATVRFGRDNVGSPFRPPDPHDASFHAIDKITPHAAVISAGGSVTFEMGPFHQVAIYDDGTQPEDIDVTMTIDLTAPPPAPPGTVIIPDFIIDDPSNRLAVGPFSFAPTSWTSPPGTFDQPGTYLVICQVVPHFMFAKMYAFVIVK